MNTKHMLAIVLLFVLSKAAFASEKFVLVQSHDKALCQAVGKVITPSKLPFYAGQFSNDPLFRDVERYRAEFTTSTRERYSLDVVSGDFDRDGTIESMIIDPNGERNTVLRIWNTPSLAQSDSSRDMLSTKSLILKIKPSIFELKRLKRNYAVGRFGGKYDIPTFNSSGIEDTFMGDFDLLKYKGEYLITMRTHTVDFDEKREILDNRKWLVVSRFIKGVLKTEMNEFVRDHPLTVLQPICYFALSGR